MEMAEIELLKMQVEILKLKANNYDWHCYVPDDVKEMLDNTLDKINKALGVNNEQ